MKHYIYFCILLLINTIQAQTSDSLLILSPEQMKEDVLFFYKKIEEIHPNPYCVLDKAHYETKKQELLNSLDKPMNKIEFWLKIGQLNSIYDAHTRVGFPGNIVEFLSENKSFFFFNGMLKARNKHLYLSNLDGIPDSLKNREILSINNIPTSEIVNNILNYISHESKITIDLHLSRSYFSLLYPLLYDMPQVLNVECVDNLTNNNKNITLSMEDFAQWDSVSGEFEKSSFKPYSFKYYEKEDIAIFDLNTFSLHKEGDKDKFDKFIKKAIDTLNMHNIKHLFVDITRNQGGNSSYANIFLDYFNMPKKIYGGEVTYKVSQKTKKYMNQVDTLTKKYYYRKTKKPCTYKNNVYLLQSNLTFSAAVTLSTLFKYNKVGTIIGEETAGLTACYIDSRGFYLPNSGFYMCSSLKAHIEPGGKWDGRGVLPDVEYQIENPEKSFTLEQFKAMLQLIEEYKKNQ